MTLDSFVKSTSQDKRVVTYEELPEPKQPKLDLGNIFFRSLLSAFLSALAVQVLLLVPAFPYSPTQTIAASVGCSLFGAGLYLAVKRTNTRPTAAYVTSIISGAILGGL